MSKNAPPPQRTDTLQRLKDHYAKRIDDSCEQMLESFHGMLRAAHVNDRPQNTRENFQLEVQSSNMINAAEALLKLVAELKHSISLNDFKSIREDANKKIENYNQLAASAESEIERLQKEIDLGLNELEESYYSSHHKALK